MSLDAPEPSPGEREEMAHFLGSCVQRSRCSFQMRPPPEYVAFWPIYRERNKPRSLDSYPTGKCWYLRNDSTRIIVSLTCNVICMETKSSAVVPTEERTTCLTILINPHKKVVFEGL
jgi:hypothetical protein